MLCDRENADHEAGGSHDQPDKDPDPLFPNEFPLLRVFAIPQKINEIDEKTHGRNVHREIYCAEKEKARDRNEDTMIQARAKEETSYYRKAEETKYSLNDRCDF